MHCSLVLNGNVLVCVCVCVRGTWVQETVLPFSSLDVRKPTRGRAAGVEAKQTSSLPPPRAFQVLFLLRCGEGEQEGRDGDLHQTGLSKHFIFSFGHQTDGGRRIKK